MADRVLLAGYLRYVYPHSPSTANDKYCCGVMRVFIHLEQYQSNDLLKFGGLVYNIMRHTIIQHTAATKNGRHFADDIFKSILLLENCCGLIQLHDDIIKWKHFPRFWFFVRGIHRSPVDSPHKGQWRGALMFSQICAWTNCWANNRDASNLRRNHAHYDVTVMLHRNCYPRAHIPQTQYRFI